MASSTIMASALRKHQKKILGEWVQTLHDDASDSKKARISPQELNAQAEEFLQLLTAVVSSGNPEDSHSAQFKALQDFLEGLSRSRVQQGFSSAETATFIFSFKKPLFAALRTEAGSNADELAQEIWTATKLLDDLGLTTVNTYQRAREEVINRQQQEMLELSTPVVKLWEGILGLPMIGTLDSARTQIVMESLLHKIVETGSEIAIIDITGVPTVDTLVAQHLLKTVTAIRLMGADCIISGVRPQIAQTIVHLGVDLQGVTTKANLADALALALKRTGATLTR
ncbi:MAG TPA: STAS domain-containing protein [Steroidobacteraceae bacterium]|jgi:rsbT co-antagonist protein RsbR|nr:STAS domain-containing protein [Steroidobacteraceae bacterium]